VRCHQSHGMFASGHIGHSRRVLRLKTATGDIHLQRIHQS
jgi:hypothetical protein